MNVVYASNDHYVRHLGVSMYSLMERNQDVKTLVCYILSVSITKANKRRLELIGEVFGRRIVFIDLDDLESRFHYTIDTGGFDISTMSRLFIGELLPSKVQRVIYLDCDTVVVRPLRQLWQMDLQNRLVGAVMEPTIYQTVKEAIDLTRKDPYFNAGVLLIDLKQWRKAEVQEALIDFYCQKGGKLFACDQDAINGVLKGRITSLPPAYNYFTNYRYFSYERMVKLSDTYAAVSRQDFIIAKKHPAIIHYMGDERPWFRGNLNHYRYAYESYLAQTPWRGTPKEKGKSIYMFCYHMMNYLTVICPEARRMISTRWGMRAVNRRRKK